VEKNNSDETRLIILGMAGITIIGELNLENKSVLRKPRVLQTVQQGDKTLLLIQPLVGDPEELFINSANFSYVPNMEIIDIYIEQTTGIKRSGLHLV